MNGENNRSVQEKAYHGILGLIPQDIAEYDDIILLLDSIYENPGNIEENKKVGQVFLEHIKMIPAEQMDNISKNHVKSLLSSIIYGYDVPDEVQKEDAQEAEKVS